MILDEFETIKYLLKHNVNVARYGDGEIKLCLGRSAKSQVSDPVIQKRLQRILKSDWPGCLVCIPRITERKSWATPEKELFWIKYTTPVITEMYDSGKLYGSAFITRPDSAPEINNKKYFDLVKSLWKDKNVLLVQGEESNFDKTQTIFNTARSKTVMRFVGRDAFQYYKEMVYIIKNNVPKDNGVVVLCLGPTATVLAYDLSLIGIQAYDLGHLGMFYANFYWESLKK